MTFRTLTTVVSGLLIALALVPNVSAQNNSGIIEGIVTRLGTTEGLAAVRITITREGQDELIGEPDAMTDAAGHFLIRNASPGLYSIRARRPGYAAPMQDGVELEDGGAKKHIVVSLEKPLDITLALTPGAVLAGRVLDPLGKAAENANVQAFLVASDGTSRVVGNSGVDDLGMYRIWGLPSGKYKLSVEYRRGAQIFEDDRVVVSSSGGVFTVVAGPAAVVQDSWVKTYFPGTVDSNRAALIEVGEAGVIEGLNFGFQMAQSFKISGTVVDPGRSQRSGIPDFYLIPLGANDGKVLDAPRMSQNNLGIGPNRQPGAFEIRGIQPGRYILYAEDWANGVNLHDNFVVSQTILDISSDISDITLVMSGTSVVEGVIRTADQQPARNARVVLIPPEELRGHPMYYKEVKTDASGKFTIKGVMPGDYTAFAIDPAEFKDTPPPSSVYALPTFLGSYAQQGTVVRAKAEERVTVSIAPVRK